MRDNRFDGPPITTDITRQVQEHSGDGVVRAVRPRKQRKNAKQAKASRKRNR